jgi:hypothetical protein
VTFWLAGGKLEIGDGIEAGVTWTAGTGEPDGTGVGGAAVALTCASTRAALNGRTLSAKSARAASVRDAIDSFKLL